MIGWKRLLEDRNRSKALSHEWAPPSGFQQGHASLEPLLLKAIKTLEKIKNYDGHRHSTDPDKLADDCLKELKAELEKV